MDWKLIRLYLTTSSARCFDFVFKYAAQHIFNDDFKHFFNEGFDKHSFVDNVQSIGINMFNYILLTFAFRQSVFRQGFGLQLLCVTISELPFVDDYSKQDGKYFHKHLQFLHHYLLHELCLRQLSDAVCGLGPICDHCSEQCVRLDLHSSSSCRRILCLS